MSWDIIAKALFVDNGAAAGVAKFNAQIHDVVRAAPGGARGFRMLETGLQSLAFEAAGIQGPIGRVAEGLLRFGGGSALVLGAVAGLGLIAAAYRASAAEAEQLQASNEKLAESWRNVAARGRPLVALGNELQKAIDAETAAQDKLNALSTPLESGPGPKFGSTRGTGGEIALAQTGLSQAQANVTQARRIFQEAQVQLAADAQKAGLKTAQAFMEGIRTLDPQVQLAVLALGQHQFGERFAKLGTDAGELYATAWLKAAQAMLDRGLDVHGQRLGTGLGRGMAFDRAPKLEGAMSPAFKPEKFPPREYFISDLEKAIVKAQPPKPDAARLAAEAVALLGALKQGGAAGILGAAGSTVSELSGLKGLGGLSPIGIGLSVASGLVGIFDHSAERRHREEMAELTRIRENTTKRGQPDHISVTVLVNGKEVSGAILQDIMYGIRRAERTNAVPVLPPSSS